MGRDCLDCRLIAPAESVCVDSQQVSLLSMLDLVQQESTLTLFASAVLGNGL